MSYPEIFRQRTIEYRLEGHSIADTAKTFKVAVVTVRAWLELKERTGGLKPKELNRPFKKIDPDKLKAHIEKHPDAFPKEIAEAFSCSATAIRKAMARLGITRKKNDNLQRTKSR